RCAKRDGGVERELSDALIAELAVAFERALKEQRLTGDAAAQAIREAGRARVAGARRPNDQSLADLRQSAQLVEPFAELCVRSAKMSERDIELTAQAVRHAEPSRRLQRTCEVCAQFFTRIAFERGERRERAAAQ